MELNTIYGYELNGVRHFFATVHDRTYALNRLRDAHTARLFTCNVNTMEVHYDR